jgi:hypothetical protein
MSSWCLERGRPCGLCGGFDRNFNLSSVTRCTCNVFMLISFTIGGAFASGVRGGIDVGSGLYPTIPPYVARALSGHSLVEDIVQTEVENEIVFHVRRKKFHDRLSVWLSDAYLFTEYDYNDRPGFLAKGDFILVARPEAGHAVPRGLVENACIGIGKLAELMGALNVRNVWTYLTPEEKAAIRRRQF